MVSELQQSILSRGKQLAKEVSQSYDDKVSNLCDIKTYVQHASNEVIAVSWIIMLPQPFSTCILVYILLFDSEIVSFFVLEPDNSWQRN